MSDIWDLFKQIGKKEEISGPPEFIIAGLGNPGTEYDRTRHNTGFMALDRVAEAAHIKIDRLKFKSYTALGELGGHRVFFMKPCTYMNLSGEAVCAAMEFYKIPIDHVIVVFDDTTLPLGKMRIRKKGSDGGHNGIKNIIYLSGSNEFPRIKIGMGQKPDGWDLADWVLSRYSEEDMKTLSPVFDNTADALTLIMDGKIEEAMGKYNGKRNTALCAVLQLYPRLCRGLYRAYRRGYICPLGRLYFLPFGQKVNVCAPCAHILIALFHRFNCPANIH